MFVILSSSVLGESVPLNRHAGQTCAHFGSLFIGSDIDGRQMRGKGKNFDVTLHTRAEATPVHEDSSPGIIRSANQYGVASRIVDLLTMDVTQHPWRSGGLFDAIVTDPPCMRSKFPVPISLLFIVSPRRCPCWRETTREKENPRNGNRTGPNVHGCTRVLCLCLSLCFHYL